MGVYVPSGKRHTVTTRMNIERFEVETVTKPEHSRYKPKQSGTKQ